MEWAPEEQAVTVQALYFSPKLDGNLPSCHIGDHHWHKEGLMRLTPCNQGDSLCFQCLDPAYHRNRSVHRPVPLEEHVIQTCVSQGKGGSSHSKLGKAVHAAGVFPIYIVQRFKIRHLCCDPSEVTGIEPGNAPDTGTAIGYTFPEGVFANAQRGVTTLIPVTTTRLILRLTSIGPPPEGMSPVYTGLTFHSLLSLILNILHCIPDIGDLSASSSGISRSNSSSNAITSSTRSSESAPRSSTKEASLVTSSDLLQLFDNDLSNSLKTSILPSHLLISQGCHSTGSRYDLLLGGHNDARHQSITSPPSTFIV